MKGFQSTILLISLSGVASAFISSSVSGGNSGACVQQKFDLSELGSAILYTCGDNQSRGAGVGATKIVNFEGYSPNGDEIALAAGPVIGYVANANNVQCALGSSVTVLQVRNANGEWAGSNETVPPTLPFTGQCTNAVDLVGRWIEANSVYTDCGEDDFQCNWVVVPDEFYGSAGPYYIKRGASYNCMVPENYIPVCQASNLERFSGFVQVRDDGLSLGIDSAAPSLYWYNNIATAQENRWVCTIPQGGAVEFSQSAPLSISGTTRQIQRSEGATLYVCEGADACSLEFFAPPKSEDSTVDPMATKPQIASTKIEGVESTDVGDAESICQQVQVLSMEDGPVQADGTIYVLQGLVGKSAHAFCSDGAKVTLPTMPGNPEWLPEALTEEEEYVPLSATLECRVPYLALPPKFHPALSCEEGFNLVGSVDSGLNESFYHMNNVYLYGANTTVVSDKFNSMQALSNAVCRQRPTSGSAGFGSWAHLTTAGALLMAVLAWRI